MIDVQMKILDNKMNVIRDKIMEFMEQSIDVSIKEAHDPNITPADNVKDKLEQLVSFSEY
jgi:hypothetical protein